MKNTVTRQLVAGALIAAATGAAYAQNASDAGTNGLASTPAASSTQGMKTKKSTAADRALRKSVVQALSKAKGLRAMGITVQARDGAVILEGWVPEQAQIELAARTAQGVAGVTSVQNALTLSTF